MVKLYINYTAYQVHVIQFYIPPDKLHKFYMFKIIILNKNQTTELNI